MSEKNRHAPLQIPRQRGGFDTERAAIGATPAIRIIRIIRSYGHMAAWHCATQPHLPGIGASSLPSLRRPEVGILPRKKMSRLSSKPTTVKKKIQWSCGGTTV